MSLIREFAIRNKLLYSVFLSPNVQIFFVQKISFASFGVSIDDFFTRFAGLGYSLLWIFYVFSVLCLLCLCARLFICALLSPAGIGLTSWRSFVVS